MVRGLVEKQQKGLLGKRPRQEDARWGSPPDRVHALSGRMLSLRLRDLKSADLIERHVEPTTPVSVHAPALRPRAVGVSVVRAGTR